jgi:hypothetical protein
MVTWTESIKDPAIAIGNALKRHREMKLEEAFELNPSSNGETYEEGGQIRLSNETQIHHSLKTIYTLVKLLDVISIIVLLLGTNCLFN